MTSTFRLGRVAGVRVGVHWSVLVVAALLAWSLAVGTLPDEVADRSAVAYWATGAITAVAFLSSVLVHELSHAAVARRNGVEVEDITIWLLGGVARLRGAATSARSELRIALAGPAASAGVAVGAAVTASIADALDADALVVIALLWLATVNAVLLVFNLVPAAPLDGGRVLSAALWAWRHDEERAHRQAATVGRWFGSALVAVGVVVVAAGDALSGVWSMFLGWFLVNAARAEETGSTVRSSVRGVTVGELMTSDPVTVPATLTVAAFVDDVMARHPYGAYPVIERDGAVVGLLSLRTVRRLSRERWRLSLGEVATPLDEVVRCAPGDALLDVMEAMQRSRDGRALVFDRTARLVGIVSSTDVARMIERIELAGAARRGRARDDHRA